MQALVSFDVLNTVSVYYCTHIINLVVENEAKSTKYLQSYSEVVYFNI